MSPDALRKAFETYSEKGITPKAVVAVNLYGQSARMDEIKDICDRYGVPLVEDAAESLGAEYHGQKVEHSVNLESFHLMVIKLLLPVVAVCLFLMIKNISNMPFS